MTTWRPNEKARGILLLNENNRSHFAHEGTTSFNNNNKGGYREAVSSRIAGKGCQTATAARLPLMKDAVTQNVIVPRRVLLCWRFVVRGEGQLLRNAITAPVTRERGSCLR